MNFQGDICPYKQYLSYNWPDFDKNIWNPFFWELNDKDCPIDNECIYAHKESENCKFAKNCERKLCKFKHVNTDECETVDASDDDDDDSSVEGVHLDQIKPVLEEFKKLWRILSK